VNLTIFIQVLKSYCYRLISSVNGGHCIVTVSAVNATDQSIALIDSLFLIISN